MPWVFDAALGAALDTALDKTGRIPAVHRVDGTARVKLIRVIGLFLLEKADPPPPR